MRIRNDHRRKIILIFKQILSTIPLRKYVGQDATERTLRRRVCGTN